MTTATQEGAVYRRSNVIFSVAPLCRDAVGGDARFDDPTASCAWVRQHAPARCHRGRTTTTRRGGGRCRRDDVECFPLLSLQHISPPAESAAVDVVRDARAVYRVQSDSNGGTVLFLCLAVQ